MAGIQEYRDAAKKRPKDRTTSEQALVDNAHSNGMTEIKNLDHEAKREQSIFG